MVIKGKKEKKKIKTMKDFFCGKRGHFSVVLQYHYVTNV